MKVQACRAAAAGLALTCAAVALADDCVSIRAVTDANGTRLARFDAQGCEIDQTPANLLWTYANTFAAIPESVAFGPNHLWAGQKLNGERLQSFELPGDGTPTDYPVTVNSPVGVGSSQGTDRVAIIDGIENSGPYSVKGFTTAGEQWNFDVPAPYGLGYLAQQCRVSRDGSTVAVGFSYYDQDTQQSFARVYFLDAATGAEISQWNGPGGVTAVSITDDGSQCLVTNNDRGRLIDRATGLETFSAAGVGSGGWYKISGNGNTIVVGGFDLQIWKKTGSTWTQAVSFSAPTSWFAWGMGVSRDGNTVVALSHIYTDYLTNVVRAWDVPSGTLLGTVSATGTGTLQGSAFGAAVSDDGNVMAVGSWGVADNAFEELRIFDRTVTQTGAVDLRGSVFSVDVSASGAYAASGSKGGHANSFGNGGDVTLFGTGGECLADFNGDAVVDFFDYLDFVQAFANNEAAADFNGDAVIDFFDYLDFVQVFAAGC